MDGMDGMDGSTHMHMSPPPSPNQSSHHHMMMHMTFYWGKEALILFNGWPGSSTGMYVLALVFVFALAFFVEWISHSRFTKPGSSSFVAGTIQTVLHIIRVGLGYMVMLAVMSFNVGVLVAAVAGHGLGFFVFGSRVFKGNESGKSYIDLPPATC